MLLTAMDVTTALIKAVWGVGRLLLRQMGQALRRCARAMRAGDEEQPRAPTVRANAETSGGDRSPVEVAPAPGPAGVGQSRVSTGSSEATELQAASIVTRFRKAYVVYFHFYRSQGRVRRTVMLDLRRLVRVVGTERAVEIKQRLGIRVPGRRSGTVKVGHSGRSWMRIELADVAAEFESSRDLAARRVIDETMGEVAHLIGADPALPASGVASPAGARGRRATQEGRATQLARPDAQAPRVAKGAVQEGSNLVPRRRPKTQSLPRDAAVEQA